MYRLSESRTCFRGVPRQGFVLSFTVLSYVLSSLLESALPSETYSKFHRHRLRHQPCCGAKASALSRTCKLVTHNQPAARSPCVFFGLSRFLLGFTNEEFQHGLQVEKHSMQQTHANATETKRDCTGCCRDISPPLAGFQVSDFDPAILWTSHDSRHNTQ